jgi:hypothetical protein
MAQTHNSLLTTTGTAINTGYSSTINGYSGTNITTITEGSGITLSENSTLNYSNQIQNNMTPKQVHVAVFTIKRDKDTNEINSTTFLKELWVEQKNGTSIDLLVAKKLDKDFDPETTIIKVLSTVSF